MAESNFGIMELLEKLLKDRGTGVSKEEQGVMGATTSQKEYDYYKDKGGDGGYQSFIDKSKMKASDNYKAGEMQYIDPLANTPQYNNATTNALDTMRGLQRSGKDGGNYYAGTGGQDLLFRNPDPFNTNPNQFINPPPEKFWNDGTTSNDPNMLQPLGAVSNIDTMFAQALSSLTPAEQSEIISATRGYNDEQVDNFKRQYLQGRVSPYELEMQSNLGF